MSCAEGRARGRFSDAASAALLVGILLLAAALRFTGLSWGLRHQPHGDERVFVENVREMIERGDLDHRFYEYPGLFFYLLRPVLALVPSGPEHGRAEYLAARGLGAFFGVVACAVLYRLGRALAGVEAALLAALLLAVSPVAVHTAHMVRPDVVLQVFVLLALLAFLRVGAHGEDDLLAGAALGLAVAVKFTGAFLLPAYLLRRALVPGRRMRGALLAGTAALAVFLLATPFAVVNPREFVAGVQTQVGFHYEETEAESPTYIGRAGIWTAVWLRALGWPACALALLGLAVALRRDARTWLPLVSLPLVTLAVMASQRMLLSRQLLPSLGVPILLAAAGTERVAEAVRARFGRGRGLVMAALCVALATVPFARSLAYVREIARPGTRDQALDWVMAHLTPGARVLTSVEALGLDEGLLEVTRPGRLGPHDRLQVLGMDFVVATAADDPQALAGLPRLATFAPESGVSGPRIVIYSVPGALRPAYRRLELRAPMLTASENAEELPAACDGDLRTLWRTLDPQRPGDWLAVALPQRARLGRIELALGESPRFAAREVQVSVSEDGSSWALARSLPVRPPVDRQRPEAGPPSQVLVLAPPLEVRFLRLGLARGAARRWGIAELGLFALAGCDARYGGGCPSAPGVVSEDTPPC